MSQTALKVLELSNDGDDLAPKHLQLAQMVVNNRANDKGIEKLEEIKEQLEEGEYTKPYYYGIEPMRRDKEGYIYYKNNRVEHFSYRDKEEEKKALKQLRDRCRKLEKEDKEINISNATGWGRDKEATV